MRITLLLLPDQYKLYAGGAIPLGYPHKQLWIQYQFQLPMAFQTCHAYSVVLGVTVENVCGGSYTTGLCASAYNKLKIQDLRATVLVSVKSILLVVHSVLCVRRPSPTPHSWLFRS